MGKDKPQDRSHGPAQMHGEEAPNTPEVKPTDGQALAFEHVFVVTYGRSGSTLLQGMLNTIDGVLIRGENTNFVFNLFEAYEALCASKAHFGPVPTLPQNAWFGIETFDPKAFLDDLRQTVQRVILGDRAGDNTIKCLGFKEIRYPEVGDKLADYLDFLAATFPNTAFVILTRDKMQVANSAWWAHEDPDWVHAFLTAFEDCAEQYAAESSNCYNINYTDIVEQTPVFKDLFTFLGAPYNAAEVDHVLSQRHSYVPNLPPAESPE